MYVLGRTRNHWVASIDIRICSPQITSTTPTTKDAFTMSTDTNPFSDDITPCICTLHIVVTGGGGGVKIVVLTIVSLSIVAGLHVSCLFGPCGNESLW